MEVFLSNLPADLTDRSLQTQLHPFLEKLSISNYSCGVQKNKKIGYLRFLHSAEGITFLVHHGESTQSKPNPNYGLRREARLFLMGDGVLCRPSTNKTMSQFDLASIRHEVEKRQSQPKRTGHTPTTFSVRELSCGHFTFANRTQFTFVSEWSSHVPWIAKFTKHNVLIKTPQRKAELRIPYATIVELIWSEKGKVALILSMPPIILVAEDPDLSDTFAQFSFKTRKGPDYTRVPYLSTEHAKVAGFCTAYCISVPADTVGGFGQGDFLPKISKLKADELIAVTQFDFTHQIAGSPGCCLPQYPDALEALHTSLKHYTQKALLPFTFSFMLEGLVRNGYLHPTVVAELGRKLVDVFQASKRVRNPPISVETFKKLFQWIEYLSPFADPRQFEAEGIMQYLEQIEGELRAEIGPRSDLSKDTQSSVNIFRAIVTPTRITFEGPELEAKNRILRKFPDHIDYFLRAQFCDENGEDMHYNPKVSLDPIYARFKQILSDGISLAGRLYGFLGFSHSSLRSHSVWLSAPFVYQGTPHFPKFIIGTLGEFKDIKSPARRAARIGQAFSETPFTVPLNTNDIVVSRIPDVERNDRIFSDGVGTISYDALECVWDALPESTGNPTSLQVRWAGAKGMLSLDGCLIGRQICIRKSMDKFPSEDGATLKICDSAYRAIPMVLNRQVIKILEDLGAPHEWFLKLQAREMKFLRGITSSVFNTASFLRSQSIGGAVRLERFLREAEKMGADYREDPFLRSAIEAVVLRDLRLLRYKARIPVEKGATLFGIMDETGFLREGQVYVTFDKMRRYPTEPPGDCEVIVTRSPALHPGDIQRVRNVVPPPGHNLLQQRNCIAFSKRGKRDLPSQLSGGDLDGDLFHVLWDPGLVGFVETTEPADYPRVKPLEIGVPITAEHMADFFVEFMKADRLGVIATRHMISADQMVEGTFHPDCLKLAKLHSSAVDFSKSGRPVEFGELPKLESYARPDFLAPGPWVKILTNSELMMDDHVAQDEEDEDADAPLYKHYYSQKILGKLYRGIQEDKIWNENIRRATPHSDRFWEILIRNFQERIDAVGKTDWRCRRHEAGSLRHVYDDAIFGLTTQWSDHPSQPLTEIEVFVGFILNKKGFSRNRQRDRSIKLKDEYDRITTGITRKMQSPATATLEKRLAMLELCFACVHIGGEKSGVVNRRARKLPDEGRSFRVLAASALMSELSSACCNVGARHGSGGFVGVRGANVPVGKGMRNECLGTQRPSPSTRR